VNSSYKYYKKQTPEAAADLMKTYEDIIKNQRAPAGCSSRICAEYGYFLIQNGKQEEGLAMLPRRKNFIRSRLCLWDHLIKKFTK
jgi:hypothetical protein